MQFDGHKVMQWSHNAFRWACKGMTVWAYEDMSRTANMIYDDETSLNTMEERMKRKQALNLQNKRKLIKRRPTTKGKIMRVINLLERKSMT